MSSSTRAHQRPKAPIIAMLAEVEAASTFLASLTPKTAPADARARFLDALRGLLLSKFQSHWNVDQPLLGSAYRAIVNSERLVDPLLVRAAAMAGAPELALGLPSDLVVWIDPHEVSYRIGEYGSVCTLYDDGFRRRVAFNGLSAQRYPPNYLVPVN